MLKVLSGDLTFAADANIAGPIEIPPMSTTESITNLENEPELRAVVGTNVDYYIARWRGSRRPGVNLAALLASGFWLPYRKMHRKTAALSGVYLALTILDTLVIERGILRSDTVLLLLFATTFAIPLTCGALGNVWYRSHVKMVIETVRQAEADESKRLTLLAERGGTSVPSVVVWTIATLLVETIVSLVLGRTLGLHI
jgi:hypothetical protein